MNIYLLKIAKELDGGYDSYDAHVVQATSEYHARKYVDEHGPHGDEVYFGDTGHVWLDPRNTCELIGVTLYSTETKVILSSFNAG